MFIFGTLDIFLYFQCVFEIQWDVLVFLCFFDYTNYKKNRLWNTLDHLAYHIFCHKIANIYIKLSLKFEKTAHKSGTLQSSVYLIFLFRCTSCTMYMRSYIFGAFGLKYTGSSETLKIDIITSDLPVYPISVCKLRNMSKCIHSNSFTTLCFNKSSSLWCAKDKFIKTTLVYMSHLE